MHKEAEDKLCDFLQVLGGKVFKFSCFEMYSLLFAWRAVEAHPVPRDLEQQLKSYARRHMRRVMPPGKDEIAPSLPHFLYDELCREAFSPVLSGHTLFHGLCTKYSSVQRDLCVRYLTDWSIMAQETLFLPGLPCESMLFVVRGSITYSKSDLPAPASSIVPLEPPWPASVLPAPSRADDVVSKLSEGDWLCEHCLWTHWNYLGQARADAGADLLCLSHDKVFELARTNRDAGSEMAKYAALAINLLNSIPEENLSDLPFELSPT